MSLLASPRRRRRLAWLAGVLVVGTAVAFGLALLPRQGGSSARTFTGPPTNPLGAPAPRPAEERAGAAAAEAVRPHAEAFVADLVFRKRLDRAHAELDPSLRRRYPLAAWRAGRNLPISLDAGKQYSVSTVLSFYGPAAVGFVSAIDEQGGAASPESTLVALRFRKADGRWRVDYIGQGHSSRFVDQSSFSPHGFLPGSHAETLRTWSILVGGFLAVVALVALLDFLLSGRRRDSMA